jgi:protein-disulfide isomerase-like protein with CxxC motif
MTSARLQYADDPLCGWCYAATPIVSALLSTEWVTLTLPGRGMLAGPRRRRMNEEFLRFIRFQEHRMHRLSGQPFGKPYTRAAARPSVVHESGQPTVTILAAEALSGRGGETYAAIERASCIEGRKTMGRNGAHRWLPKSGSLIRPSICSGFLVGGHGSSRRRLDWCASNLLRRMIGFFHPGGKDGF